MRNLAEWLPEEQAGLGGDRIDAPAAGFVGEDREVLVRKVSPQAESESSLSGRCPVAGTHVASGLAERRDHVATKTDRRRPLHALNSHGGLDFVASQSGDNLRRPVSLGNDAPLGGNNGNARVAAQPFHRSRCVLDRAVRARDVAIIC